MAYAQKDVVTVDVRAGQKQIANVELARGQSVEVERIWSGEHGVAVHSGGLIARIGTSFLRTVADSPFLSAVAVWALLFNKESIKNHPYASMFVGGILFSDFALHLLHSADQKIVVAK